MDDLTYLNFDLQFQLHGDKYQCRVTQSPAGEAKGEFAMPLADLPRQSWPDSAPSQLGQALFEAAFRGQVENCLRRSLDRAQSQGKGLRLRLRLVDTPELAELPWEYLFDASLSRFLALSVDTPIVRYLGLPEPVTPLAVKPPLRVLVMISAPIDRPELDADQEWDRLVQALGGKAEGDLVVLDRLEEATLGTLQKRLRQNDYHIFHFIGHGGFDKSAQDGILLFEDDEQKHQRVTGSALGMLLGDERTLRLAILNACEGARASKIDPFSGTAQSLVRSQIPAVIAMQSSIADKASKTFTSEFYTALADGYPVDAALTEARKALHLQGAARAWGTPVLYMRSDDGHIFDLSSWSQSKRESGPSQSTVPSEPATVVREPSPPASVQSGYTQRARPARGGDSIGLCRFVSAATLGCLVADRQLPHRVHVVCDFTGVFGDQDPRAGEPILQPGRADGGDPNADAIATVSRWTDVATISQVLRLQDVSPQIHGRGYLQGVRGVSAGMRVYAVGRTGGLVAGTVKRIDWSGSFVECTPMLQVGDSGAILMDAENYAIGLAFGIDPSEGTSLFVPIQSILDAFDVDLVTEDLWRSLTA